VAAYGFGHSMVRAVYDHNRNSGRGANVLPNSPFNLLFLFTGKAPRPFGGTTDVLPFNWIVEWDRFVDKDGLLEDRYARRIDTHLAPPLGNLDNEAKDETSKRIRRILRRLAVRNLLRGYRLALPTGQAVARSLGIAPLTRDQLITPEPAAPLPPFLPSPVDDALVDGGFLDATPLWFYVLKEAEVLGEGQRLGPVGSRIVAETIIGQLRADPTSFLNSGWDPSQGVTKDGEPVDTILRFLRFAGMHP
jgi:hypothetical protein